LWRLRFGDYGHVFGRQLNRSGFPGFDLPEDEAEGKNHCDGSGDESFSCGIQNTVLS
jgi:hypothetical protein